MRSCVSGDRCWGHCERPCLSPFVYSHRPPFNRDSIPLLTLSPIVLAETALTKRKKKKRKTLLVPSYPPQKNSVIPSNPFSPLFPLTEKPKEKRNWGTYIFTSVQLKHIAFCLKRLRSAEICCRFKFQERGKKCSCSQIAHLNTPRNISVKNHTPHSRNRQSGKTCLVSCVSQRGDKRTCRAFREEPNDFW